MTDTRRLIKLSKFVLLILHHQPERFALQLDEEGWASLAEVMEILRGLPNFRWASRADVMQIVEEGSGDGKRRFEVQGERIRSVDRQVGKLVEKESRGDPLGDSPAWDGL
jgi:putative RNA 2'-phosphotransferase